ncbi:putative peptide maturation dehydrogenase [Xanthomonas floridensis]|uniref:Peptide maturation dehydrogenase n=1 Tax=Xanthomonas floridensis TaxID=1843580 RepID=A0A1A9M970_9XANT|nr:putative peptide maturation dehydrogenase [Xanthomonas floridensis]MEA5125462.1 putative peptide maturation dehydrogenase [Xanthomonas floridensis]MEA5133271.1 putative peptide maturation dehydrogenase [Xanthomonas floridensis]OAG67074.1 putative peptide maturation dehydrogenase [Xanthomonas floridensis]
MLVRRCAVVYVEPRERIGIDLLDLCAGGAGASRTREWVALAPHLGAECVLTDDEMFSLGRSSPSQWQRQDVVGEPSVVQSLLDKGLLLVEGASPNAAHDRDQTQRKSQWHPLAATYHAFTRWDNVDSAQAAKDAGADTAAAMLKVFGPPPPEQVPRGRPDRIALMRGADGHLDKLLRQRTTCRNFDADQQMEFADFSKVIERVFAANAVLQADAETVFLKRSSPSGGGLHPLDAYLIIRKVSGITDGVYHYLPIDHALEPLHVETSNLQDVALTILAGQDWFCGAQVIVALCPRYYRNFWKYRVHAKAYRALNLEAGHFSQTLYMAATEVGLGAFVTCAINEVQVEALLGLEPIMEGVLAVCGFGIRADVMQTMELDPNNEVWACH